MGYRGFLYKRNSQSEMASYKLLLDADCQTDATVRTAVNDSASLDLVEINQQLVRMQMNLVSRINELEIQNSEIMQTVLELTRTVDEFKQKWEQRTRQEKDSDLLMRNVGLLS